MNISEGLDTLYRLTNNRKDITISLHWDNIIQKWNSHIYTREIDRDYIGNWKHNKRKYVAHLHIHALS